MKSLKKSLVSTRCSLSLVPFDETELTHLSLALPDPIPNYHITPSTRPSRKRRCLSSTSIPFVERAQYSSIEVHPLPRRTLRLSNNNPMANLLPPLPPRASNLHRRRTSNLSKLRREEQERDPEVVSFRRVNNRKERLTLLRSWSVPIALVSSHPSIHIPLRVASIPPRDGERSRSM